MPARLTFLILIFVSSYSSAAERGYDAILTGHVDNVSSPQGIWIGAIEVRFREIFVLEEKSADALSFMRALAMRREVECRLTGERLAMTEGFWWVIVLFSGQATVARSTLGIVCWNAGSHAPAKNRRPPFLSGHRSIPANEPVLQRPAMRQACS